MRATRFSRGTLGVAGVLCLGLSGLGATALAAPDGPGNIDFAKTGSIIINKHEAAANGTKGDVAGGGAVQGAPIAGVTFTAYKLNADLNNNDDWKTLSTLQVPADACGADFKTPKANLDRFTVDTATATNKAETQANGKATISNLAVSAYLVCETEAPANVAQKSAPFVVTIPFPNTTGNVNNGAAAGNDGGWLYDVNVYPKNVLIEKPTKGAVVNSNGLKTGAQVEFPITAKVPAVAAGSSFKHFMISDPMPAGYEDPDLKGSQVFLDNNPVDANWYKLTKNAGNEINVSFTQLGLTELAKPENAGKTISLTFTAKVTNVAAAIENVAKLYVDTVPQPQPPNDPPVTPPGDEVPSNKVVTAWGAAKIFKKADQNNLGLEGAQFAVYNAKTPYPVDGTCTKEIATDDDPATTADERQPISIDGNAVFTSGADGKVTIEGLFVDKAVAVGDAQAAIEHSTRCYVVVETKAPEGFVLPQGQDANTPLKITAGQTADANELSIVNTKTTVPQLPLTGAAGKILMTVGGLSLMAIAVGFVLAARKRRVNEA